MVEWTLFWAECNLWSLPGLRSAARAGRAELFKEAIRGRLRSLILNAFRGSTNQS